MWFTRVFSAEKTYFSFFTLKVKAEVLFYNQNWNLRDQNPFWEVPNLPYCKFLQIWIWLDANLFCRRFLGVSVSKIKFSHLLCIFFVSTLWSSGILTFIRLKRDSRRNIGSHCTFPCSSYPQTDTYQSGWASFNSEH